MDNHLDQTSNFTRSFCSFFPPPLFFFLLLPWTKHFMLHLMLRYYVSLSLKWLCMYANAPMICWFFFQRAIISISFAFHTFFDTKFYTDSTIKNFQKCLHYRWKMVICLCVWPEKEKKSLMPLINLIESSTDHYFDLIALDLSTHHHPRYFHTMPRGCILRTFFSQVASRLSMLYF